MLSGLVCDQQKEGDGHGVFAARDIPLPQRYLLVLEWFRCFHWLKKEWRVAKPADEGDKADTCGGLGCSYTCKCAHVKPDPDLMVTRTGIMQSTHDSAVKEYSLKFQRGTSNSALNTSESC